MKRRPLRVPQRPHSRDERGVPKPHCGCDTCHQMRLEQRSDDEAAHWRRVGKVVGVDEKGEKL
jgi:hypothetical protein